MMVSRGARKFAFLGRSGIEKPAARNLVQDLEAMGAVCEAGASLEEAVLDHIRRRFGNLVLMKYEKVDVKKPLAEYGMDSMIGAEFRTWLYQNFAVEVPLLILLNKTCTLESLRDKALAEKEKE